MIDVTDGARERRGAVFCDRKLVAFSGAGLSADSGIPTYRDGGGLWEGYDPHILATFTTWRKNADAVRRFYNARRRELAGREPNPAHHMLARWQRRFGATLVTQNVDDLLERAGASDVLHVHGRLTEMCCLACGRVWDIGYRAWSEGERCVCGSHGAVKPGVVFFGEHAPGYSRMRSAFRRLREHDVLVVIGTSGEVVDISSIVVRSRATTVLNNLTANAPLDESCFQIVVRGRAAEIAPMLDEVVSGLMVRKP